MKDFNEKLFVSGEVVAVGLSGGADSVCLLHELTKRAAFLKIKVVAVNVEHGIRGEASVKDSEFCENLCKNLSVPIKCYTVNAALYSQENGLSLEEGARILRYQCFFDAISGGFCDKIALAHHADDNAETVLFNMFRGTTVHGAAGIKPVAYDGKIVRPLLNISRDKIIEYITENGLEYVTDETNGDAEYSRNFIRNEVIPLIASRFPGVKDAINRFSQSAASDDEYLYQAAEKMITVCKDCVKIPTGLPYPIFSRCAVLAVKKVGVLKDFDNRHIEALFALTTNISGKKVDLLKGLYGIREHDFIVIKKYRTKHCLSQPFSVGRFNFDNKTVTIEPCCGFKKDGLQYVDYDKIPQSAEIRTRREGDEFTKFGGGKVSLKKFLTDKKIPADSKSEVLLVADKNTVYVVIGVEISSLCKIDDSTKNSVKITVE